MDYDPCMLKTSFVDFEKEYMLIIAVTKEPNFTYSVAVKVVYLVCSFSILLNLFLS